MTDGTQPTSTAAEIAHRRKALEEAEHSGEMEGLQVSPAVRADAEDYASGRIGIDALVARGRERYGLTSN